MPCTNLSVNVNKVATLRNARGADTPNLLQAVKLCLDAGAAGITVHPRPDQRHIRHTDVHEIAAFLKNYSDSREFNIEGNPFHEYMHLVHAVRPTQCTLVPDDATQTTSDHGWNFEHNGKRLVPVIAELKSLGSRVSLFIDPDPIAAEQAAALGADRVELYTASFAEAFARGGGEAAIAVYLQTARRAQQLGLMINAGHDLNLQNLSMFLERVPGVSEVSIGQALIADALEFGLTETIHRYLAAMS